MADLSLRMQDTLAEIRSGSLIHGASNQEMLAQMEAARGGIVAAIRDTVEQLNTETANRKQGDYGAFAAIGEPKQLAARRNGNPSAEIRR
jgi:hypothetical protein